MNDIPYLDQRRNCGRALSALASVSSWSRSDLSWHNKQIDRFFNDLQSLRQRVVKPDQHAARRLRKRLLSSYSGILCGFLQEQSKRGLRHLKPLSPVQLERHIRSARPTRRIFEHAIIKTHTKPNGKKRITVSPGPKVRTAQWLVSDLLEASGVANPFDYSRTGRGPHKAIAEIIRLVEEEGVKDFVVFDLENCFTSVDAKHLKGVPLPRQVMKHSVMYNRHAILVHSSNDAAEAEAARHGLPQGARVSGILASAFIGRELRHLDGAMGIVTYVDDGVIGACDPAGAKSLAEAIKVRFGKHPGGPLGFKKLEACSIQQGFTFLGYYLRLDALSEQPKVYIQPSHEAREKFKRKLMRKLGSISPKPDWDQAIEIAHRYFEYWREAFPLWQPTEAKLDDIQFLLVETFVDDFLSGFTSNHVLPKPLMQLVGCCGNTEG